MFLFIPKSLENIPIHLVFSLQKLGRGVKWIRVQDDTTEVNRYLLAFMLGKLHEKLPTDIEFALLADTEVLDDLIEYINDKGRTCLRVLGADQENGALNFEPAATETKQVHSNGQARKIEQHATLQAGLTSKPQDVLVEAEDIGIRSTALKITEWLMRTGNRPAEIGLLKQYISINNPDLPDGNAERIISYMAMNNDIQIQEKEVMYNF